MEKSAINLPEEKFSYYESVLKKDVFMAPFKLAQGDYGVSQARLESRMIESLRQKGLIFKHADWFDFIVYYFKA